MAYELDSQAWERLRALYAEMSDGELLEMAQRPEDLTDMAQQALRGEMTSRRLQPPAPDRVPERRWASDTFAGAAIASPPVSPSILGSGPDLGADLPEESDVQRGEVLLRTFHDAFEMARACESLEAAEVGLRVQDVSKPSTGIDGYSPVALNLIVSSNDRDRAMTVLRKEMGLFPLQEVSEADAEVDDGTVSQVGYFGSRADADVVAGALESARIWNRVAANPEGSAATEDAWVVEVREVDLMRAGDVVEKALGMA